MPKRLLLALGIAAFAVAACHNSSSTPNTSFTPLSPSPNPSIKKATILVTIAGTPAAKIPVEQSTPRNPTSPRPGKAFETKNTGKKGMVHFTGLKPNGTYCWVAVFSPSFRSSQCASWAVWQTSVISLGT
ncbi:MAG: hypothetical protein WCC84_02575 [Candidatus Cybelea sp.]